MELGQSLELPPAKRRRSLRVRAHVESSDRSYNDSDVETQFHSSSTNSEKCTKWAMSNFSEWQKRRKARFPREKEQQVPTALLKSSDPKLINKWLALYAAETRRLDSGEFSPKTLYYLLAGVLRHMRSLNPACPNFLQPANTHFKPLHDSLWNTFEELEASNTEPEPSDMETLLHHSNKTTSTERNTKWALSNFSKWQKRRIARFPGNEEQQVPPNLLNSSDPKLLNKWLSLYITEARKQGGGAFHPTTIYLLLAGLLRHMRSLNPSCPDFLRALKPAQPHSLYPSSSVFKPLHDALQNTFCEFQASNPASETRSAEPFSEEEEDQLWTSGALSTDTPMGLLCAVFFLNGKNLGLCGGDKHRLLKISQLTRVTHPSRYVYDADKCTGKEEGLTHFWQKKHKTDKVFVDAIPEKGNRCHVHVLDLYLQNLPTEALEQDIFYLQPTRQYLGPSKKWFTTQPVGVNRLSRMVKEICVIAGIEGLKTNFSLKATSQVQRRESYPTGMSTSSPDNSITPDTQQPRSNSTNGQPLTSSPLPQGTTTLPQLSETIQTDTTRDVSDQAQFFIFPVQDTASGPDPTAAGQPTAVPQLQATQYHPRKQLNVPQALQNPTTKQQTVSQSTPATCKQTTPKQPQSTNSELSADKQPTVSQSTQCTAAEQLTNSESTQLLTAKPPTVLQCTPTKELSMPCIDTQIIHQQPQPPQTSTCIPPTTNAQPLMITAPGIHAAQQQMPPQTMTNPPSGVSLTQGPNQPPFPPQRLTFTNCHVSIILTPFQPPP